MGGRISRLTPDIIDASSLPNAFPEMSRSQRTKVQSTYIERCECALLVCMHTANDSERSRRVQAGPGWLPSTLSLGPFPGPCRHGGRDAMIRFGQFYRVQNTLITSRLSFLPIKFLIDRFGGEGRRHTSGSPSDSSGTQQLARGSLALHNCWTSKLKNGQEA